MLHRLEDRISDDLTNALTRTIRRWFGDPRRAGIERVNEQEIETICQLASRHVDRLFRAGWVNESKRKERRILIYAVGFLGAFLIADSARLALDLNGDGQLTIADAHALVDVLGYGRTEHIPIKIRTRDGRHIVLGYSYGPDAERVIEELPSGR